MHDGDGTGLVGQLGRARALTPIMVPRIGQGTEGERDALAILAFS
jgi:hypothetical protein